MQHTIPSGYAAQEDSPIEDLIIGTKEAKNLRKHGFDLDKLGVVGEAISLNLAKWKHAETPEVVLTKLGYKRSNQSSIARLKPGEYTVTAKTLFLRPLTMAGYDSTGSSLSDGLPDAVYALQGVWMKLERHQGPALAYYRLAKDKWFRRYMSSISEANGQGLMIRSFKISGKGKPGRRPGGGFFTEFPLQITYFTGDDEREDKPANHQKALGTLFIRDDIDGLTPEAVQSYVRRHMSKYKP